MVSPQRDAPGACVIVRRDNRRRDYDCIFNLSNRRLLDCRSLASSAVPNAVLLTSGRSLEALRCELFTESDLDLVGDAIEDYLTRCCALP